MSKARPAIREGSRNPLEFELLSAAAERGNYLKPSPTEMGLKADERAKERKL
jgi:hypothetical protein